MGAPRGEGRDDLPRFLGRLAPDADPVAAIRPAEERTRVGVEVEFAGVELEQAATVIAQALEGEVRRENDRQFEIVAAGDPDTYRLEVDQQLLKDCSRRREAGEEVGVLEAASEAVISAAAGSVVPLELVSPPLPWARLPRLDQVATALGRAGATGTREGLLAAFGVHYNPELLDLSARSIRDHLRAYLVLEPWLRDELSVDLSRRLTPFIDPFPVAYQREVLAPDDDPDLDAFTQQYLEHNPTRNRSLDLLPLLAHLREALVAARVDDELVNARPTFHYRLTDSRVGEDGWTVGAGWRRWLVVEDLARDGPRLERLSAEYRRFLGRASTGKVDPAWSRRVVSELSP